MKLFQREVMIILTRCSTAGFVMIIVIGFEVYFHLVGHVTNIDIGLSVCLFVCFVFFTEYDW
jgi:hypothetical protein